MKTIRLFAVAALFAAAVEASDLRDACASISRLSIAQASGLDVAQGVAGVRTPGVSSCSFIASNGGRVILLVRRDPPAAWVTEQVARMKRGVQLGAYREWPGGGGRQSFLYVHGDALVMCTFDDSYYSQLSLLGFGRDSKIISALLAITAAVPATAPAANPLASPRSASREAMYP
jgi:hypothetical protein